MFWICLKLKWIIKKKKKKRKENENKYLHLLPPKLACFLLYLKIINIFMKNYICIL